MDSLKSKYTKLKRFLGNLDSVAIAFSGGLDSGVLAKLAFDCLGKDAVAVTASSPTHPLSELKAAKRMAKEIGIKQLLIHTKEFNDKKFIINSTDRCYWCKKELFLKIKKIAHRYGIKYILDGTNYDDKDDRRPGLKANKEFNVISPFFECKLTKKEIRSLAKKLGLSFWAKPQGACLSSRIPFNEKITIQRLKRIEAAEKELRSFLGKNILFRARDHRDTLRIELENKDWTKLKKSGINKLTKSLKKIGYKYITIDLEGYIPAGLRI